MGTFKGVLGTARHARFDCFLHFQMECANENSVKETPVLAGTQFKQVSQLEASPWTREPAQRKDSERLVGYRGRERQGYQVSS